MRRPLAGLCAGGLTLAVTALGGGPARVPAAEGPPARDAEAVPRYHLSTWGTGQGLPDARVQAVLQTRDGYLWVGTVGGLARFDGLRFRLFTHRNVEAFESDNCLALAEDREGVLWIGTSSGLIRYADREFTLLGPQQGLAEQEVLRLQPASGGGVWVATLNALQRVGASHMSEVFPVQGVDVSVLAFHERSNGRPELLSDFFRAQGDTGLPAGRSAQADLIRREYTDPDGTQWLASADRVYRRAVTEKSFQQVLRLERADDYVNALRGDDQGTIWVASASSGLMAIHGSTLTRFSPTNGLPGHCVRALATDLEGNVWAGLDPGGLVRLRPATIGRIGPEDGLLGLDTWAVLQGRDGTVWVGTDDGLTAFGPQGVRHIGTDDGLPSPRVRALLEDRSGTLWIGTMKGLARWHHSAVHEVALPRRDGAAKIRTMLEDAQGTVWVGTAYGVHRFAGDSATWLTTTNGLPHNDVAAMWESPDHVLWFGTRGGGIGRFEAGSWHRLSTTNGLPSEHISVLTTDATGQLWVGTANGLAAWQGGSRFAALTTREGLLESIINGIVDDHQGGLWLTGNEGVYRCGLEELQAAARHGRGRVTPAVFDIHDGLPSNETNGERSHPTTCRTATGELWLPTKEGVAVVDPRRVGRNLMAPPVAIETLFVDGRCAWGDAVSEELDPAGGREHGQRGLVRAARWHDGLGLVLPPAAGRLITINYTANTFSAPEHTRFRYRMEGVDDDWIEAGNRREAYYTALRPGRHRFQVLAANSHGVWNATGAMLIVKAQPRFYQTGLFGASVALSLIMLGGFLYRLRERFVHRLRTAEETSVLERERTRIANDIHDDLGARLTRVVFLSQMAEQDRAGAAAAPPLTGLIRESAREAVQSLAEVVWATNPKRDDLDSLATFICQQAEKFTAGLSVRLRLEIQKPLPSVPLCSELRHNLFRVVKEAMNNALKHSRGETLTIRLTYHAPRLVIEVQDDGAGFDPRAEADSGNGLQGMEARMQVIGGQLTIESRLGRGTCVRMNVHLPDPKQERRRRGFLGWIS